jgi:dethiobiotin synthetase
MRGLFISGTDTGVGKTVLTAALAARWRAEGRRFRVCKPVATGSAEDTEALARAAGDEDREAITPWTFAEPAAPPVAARLAGVRLSLAELAAAVRRRAEGGSAVLVEGVGGLCCPLTDDGTVADLVAELGLPLVVVARRSLGTLNHTLLTAEVALRRGLPLAGVVLSETTPMTSLAERTCGAELRRRLPVPVLTEVAHGGRDLGGVDWWGLAGQAPLRPAEEG